MIFAGSHTLDITPENTVDLNGYILRFGRSQGIHDRLTANFLYLKSKGKEVLLVSTDTLTIGTSTADGLRQKISQATGIEKESILLAAIHTHSAIGDPLLRNVGEECKEWKADFESKMVDGSKKAKLKSAPCKMYAYETFSAVGRNRRKSTRGTDPNAPFIVIKLGNDIIAWIVNYNCHPVSLTEKNLQISADYVHYMRNYLYNKTGQTFPVLFFNGGSGDVDPVRRGGFEEAQFNGEKLGEEILDAYRIYDGEEVHPEISCKTTKLTIPYAWNPSHQEAIVNLEKYKERLNGSTTEADTKIAGAFYIWAKDVLAKVEAGTLPQSLTFEVSLITIGQTSFFAVPLEIFSSISLKLRKYFREKFLFVVSYGNGYSGYLADKTAYAEGGYEVEDWHKYAGILPQVPYAEDIFWNGIKNISNK